MKAYRKSRIKELVKFDRQYSNLNLVIGVDEVGRGPVAGPVVACAAYLFDFNKDSQEVLKYLDDSKKFSSNSKLRKELAEEVKKLSKYSISECSVREIEEYNILQASLLAMKRACLDLAAQLNHDKDLKLLKNINVLIDGRFPMRGLDFKQQTIIKGDTKSASIAAASIIAKVYRDELMTKLAEEFPLYNWHKNKGYPTPYHLEAIKEHGICIWHRKSFLKKVLSSSE